MRERGDRIAVVVSAMGDSTDRLVDLAAGIAREPDRARDGRAARRPASRCRSRCSPWRCASAAFPRVRSPAARSAFAPPTSTGARASPTVETKRLRETMDAGDRARRRGIPGHRRRRATSRPSAVAARTPARWRSPLHSKADECQILTDVDGVYTTDPRLVPDARLLSRISFEEMLELAGQGSRVLHLRSVEFAAKYNVPLRVLSSFRPGSGTLICKEETQRGSPAHFRHRVQSR